MGMLHTSSSSLLPSPQTSHASKHESEGMLVTQGGRFGGYGLYLLKGKPVFVYNLLGFKRVRWEGKERIEPGKHTVVFDFAYDGGGLGKGGLGILKVDGKEVAKERMVHTLPFTFQWDETFDIGIDTGTPVDDADYQVPFHFTGTVNKVTVEFAVTPTSLMKTRKLCVSKVTETTPPANNESEQILYRRT